MACNTQFTLLTGTPAHPAAPGSPVLANVVPPVMAGAIDVRCGVAAVAVPSSQIVWLGDQVVFTLPPSVQQTLCIAPPPLRQWIVEFTIDGQICSQPITIDFNTSMLLCDDTILAQQLAAAFDVQPSFAYDFAFQPNDEIEMRVVRKNLVNNQLTQALDSQHASIAFAFVLTTGNNAAVPDADIADLPQFGNVGSNPKFTDHNETRFKVRPEVRAAEQGLTGKSFALQAMVRVSLPFCPQPDHNLPFGQQQPFIQVCLAVPTMAVFFRDTNYQGELLVVAPQNTMLVSQARFRNAHIDYNSRASFPDLLAQVTDTLNTLLIQLDAFPFGNMFRLPQLHIEVTNIVNMLTPTSHWVWDSTASLGSLEQSVADNGWPEAVDFDHSIKSAILIGMPQLCTYQLFDDFMFRRQEEDVVVPPGTVVASVPDFTQMSVSDTVAPYPPGAGPAVQNWSNSSRSILVEPNAV